jgi:prolyl-tRNA editing enzyme YbaK/EbsC (Cys-tRNA(Pro) deacylase)
VRSWPEPVERVAAFLRAAGADARLEEFSGGTPTARDAARAVGCDLQQIVKSIVILCDGRPVVVLVPGDRRADVERVRRFLECAGAHVATPQEVLEATGFEPGAVAPFPLPRVHRVLVERTLLAHEIVWVGAGSSRHMAGLEPGELVRLSRATPIHATEG